MNTTPDAVTRDIARQDEQAKRDLAVIQRSISGSRISNQHQFDEPPQYDRHPHYEDVSVENDDGKPRKQADVLIDIGRHHYLFHSPARTAYARVGAAVYPIEGSQYRQVLAELFLNIVGKGANRNALGDAVTTLASLALFKGGAHPVWLRTGAVGEKIVIDVGRNDWQMIEVGAGGWRWRDPKDKHDGDSGLCMFRRTTGVMELPAPDTPDFGRIWKYLNIRNVDRPLVAGFMLMSLRPTGPYPILFLSGEQGTGKSTMIRVIRRLTDPSVSPLRSPPKDVRDLLVGALNSWVLALDNLSYLGPQLSDALCRLATGGAISERTLYTNVDEVLIEVQRPVMVNGIEDLATRPDLAERGIHIEMEPIDRRVSEEQFWIEFEKDAPHIFGGLLSGLAAAIKGDGQIEVGALPRMADFAMWAMAGIGPLGFTSAQFLDAYRGNIETGMGAGVDSSPVGLALLEFIEQEKHWEGTSTELLKILEEMAGEGVTRSKAWPRSPRKLSGVIARLAPALRHRHITVDKPERSSGSRPWLLCHRPDEPSLPSSPPPNDEYDGRTATLHKARPWSTKL